LPPEESVRVDEGAKFAGTLTLPRARASGRP
jgi:hypothetical protein